MKLKTKIISISMCLCLVLLSACSQNSSVEPEISTNSANTSSAGNTSGEVGSDPTATESNSADTDPAAVTEGNTENTIGGETATTAVENSPAEDDRLAYYDLLREEYEKYGKLSTVTYLGYDVVCENGKVIFPVGLWDEKIMVYDVEKKEIIAEANGASMGTYYVNCVTGYIYNLDHGTLSKYDSSGNLLDKIDNGTLMPDGSLITCSKGFMYFPDWKTKIEFPPLEIDAEHGLKKEVENYSCVAKYKNKVYVHSSHDDTKGYYCLDTDTMTWETVESELKDIEFHSNGCDIIGRYMLLGNKTQDETVKIYDMETDTMIAHILSPEFEYDGRDYQLELKEGKLTKYRFPNGGSIPITETVLDTGDKSLSEWYGTFVPVDEQYYVYRDEYGVFLREYGKGEDGEITIELFDR